jgi:hypothetical protein
MMYLQFDIKTCARLSGDPATATAAGTTLDRIDRPVGFSAADIPSPPPLIRDEMGMCPRTGQGSKYQLVTVK